MEPVVLPTERLVLRPFALGDASEVQRLAGDRAVADTTLHVPHPYLDGMAESWNETHAPLLTSGRGVVFAITARDDGRLLGAISLLAIVRGHSGSLGYWIGRPHWSHGYCTEAGHAVLRHAFDALSLRRVHAEHLRRNPASGRVMQKLGMRHEGTQRAHVLKWGVAEDLELYGILASDR